jgi:hypothetical protein
MTIKTFGIGCGAVVLGLLVFLGYRVANPWEFFTFSGYEVRRNRLTERIEVKTGDTWQVALNNDPYAPTVSEADLARVKLVDAAFGPNAYFCGKVTVSGNKPVVGRLAFLINVADIKTGKRRTIQSERALRCNVNFKPGPPQTFVIHTDMTLPTRDEKYRVELIPVRAVE